MRTARLSLRGTLVALVLSSCNAIATTQTPRTAHPTLGRPLPLPRRQLACARMCEPAMDVATGQGGSLERSDEILLRAEMMELQLRLSSLREQASSHHTHKSCVCHNSHSPIILRHLSHTPPVTRPLFLPIPDTVFFWIFWTPSSKRLVPLRSPTSRRRPIWRRRPILERRRSIRRNILSYSSTRQVRQVFTRRWVGRRVPRRACRTGRAPPRSLSLRI